MNTRDNIIPKANLVRFQENGLKENHLIKWCQSINIRQSAEPQLKHKVAVLASGQEEVGEPTSSPQQHNHIANTGVEDSQSGFNDNNEKGTTNNEPKEKSMITPSSNDDLEDKLEWTVNVGAVVEKFISLIIGKTLPNSTPPSFFETDPIDSTKEYILEMVKGVDEDVG
jgi:hypothetical protein